MGDKRMELVRKIHEDRKKMLRRIYRQSSRYQVRQRAHCLLLYQEGYSITRLEDIFQVSRKTVYNWLNAWESRGLIGLYNQKGQGRKPTFSPEHRHNQLHSYVSTFSRQSPNAL